MARAVAAGVPQTQFLTPEQFLTLTKMKSSKVISGGTITEGGQARVRLPQAGLGHIIWLSIQGSLAITGTQTATFWNPYTATVSASCLTPAPWGLIKRLRLQSNNAFSLRDLSGWSLAKWLRARYGKEFESILNSNVMTAGLGGIVGGNSLMAGMFQGGSAAVLTTNQKIVPGAALVASTTYPINMLIPIPISYNNAGETGLLVLQQNSTFYDLLIDWGQLTFASTSGTAATALNDVASGTGTTVVGAFTGTYSVGLDWFEPVPGIGNLISMFMSVNDMVQTPVVVGENVVRPPVNDLYTMFIIEAFCNGLPVPGASLSNLTFQHSGNVYDMQEDYLTNMARFYWQHGLLPTNGSFIFDLGMRRGELLRRDTFDAFNYTNVTDLQIRFTNGTAVGSQSQISTVMESLRAIQQI